MRTLAARQHWAGALDSPWAVRAVVAAALLLRLLVWRFMEGPVIRGDGSAYLEWAQRISRADFSGFADYPLHQLYPMLIAPAYSLGLPLSAYLLVLHMALSVGTVVCLYDVTRQFASRRVAMTVAAVAAVYPAFLLWSAFVLSETPFFFFFSLFLVSLTRLVSRPDARRGAWPLAFFALASALMLFARPVSVAVLAIALVAVAYKRLSDSLALQTARLVTVSALAVVLLSSIAILSLDEPLRQTVVRYPTVAQSLWLSTRYSSSSVAEWQLVTQQSQALFDRFGGDLNAIYDYKVGEALDFIRTRPGAYALLAGRRFTSYWFPAFFSDGWSASHRLFDLILALALYVGAIASLYGRRDIVRWTLLSVALSLGILTSFSQIDTDGRYRVPAELVLLPLATDGWVRLSAARWRRGVEQKPRQPATHDRGGDYHCR